MIWITHRSPVQHRFRLACAAFAALLAVFFFPVVFQHKVLAPLDILEHLMRPWSDGAGGAGVHNAMVYDAISQYLPYNWAVFQSITQDGYIGWSPDVYGGYPLLENTMLCPGDWHHQLYRFLDFWTAWDLGIILQFAIAGIGMIIFLSAEGLSSPASLLGAVCFSFYSQHTIWIYHRWVLGTSCWFPWMAWAIRRARKQHRSFALLPPVFTALAFRGGSLQTCIFVVLIVFCLFAADFIEHRQDLLHCRKNFFSFFGFYAFLAVMASTLAADVFVNTIPSCLVGMRQMSRRSFLECLMTLPHFGTLIVPSLFGSPQTLDAGKLFGTDMFSTKFAGAVAIMISLAALPKKDAPKAAKWCFTVSLLAVATPLVNWIYNRSTVVFAFGCAWLAAWTLDNASRVVGRRWWMTILHLGIVALIAWTATGVIATTATEKIRPFVRNSIERALPQDRTSRKDWMLGRADKFIDEFPPWSASNSISIALVAFGLLAFRMVCTGPKSRTKDTLLKTTVAMFSFCELFAWNRSWTTFSCKPDTDAIDSLYSKPPWAESLVSELSNGGFLWFDGYRQDFDWFQPNTQSGLGISSLQGYETIKPQSICVANPDKYDPEAFAHAGISHVIVNHASDIPLGLDSWQEVVISPQFRLFRNPEFKSRFFATLQDGRTIPLLPISTTPNSLVLDIPAGTQDIHLAMTWHRRWTFSICQKPSSENKAIDQELPVGDIKKNEDGSMSIAFPSPTGLDCLAKLRYLGFWACKK